MRKTAFLLVLTMFSSLALAQFKQTTTWDFDASKKEVKVGDEVELIFKVSVIDDWHIYSSDLGEDIGPMPTEINFEDIQGFELTGPLVPINPKKKYDDIWEAEVTYFEKEGEFRQKIKITSTHPVIKGTLDFQTCTDVDGQCIPGDQDFSIDFLKIAGAKKAEESKKSSGSGDTPKADEETRAASSEVPEPEDYSSLLQGDERASLWFFFVAAFLFGLAALLTPCVFPMIPMTVAFFTSHSQSRSKAKVKALTYGLSIIAIYILIGLVFTSFFGVGLANDLATGAVANILFFVVFVIFAISFFGYFEISIPTGFVNRMDKKAEKGGFLGVFFMAFTLVLVSFSCTGPIVGTVLIQSFQGEVMKPVVGWASSVFRTIANFIP